MRKTALAFGISLTLLITFGVVTSSHAKNDNPELIAGPTPTSTRGDETVSSQVSKEEKRLYDIRKLKEANEREQARRDALKPSWPIKGGLWEPTDGFGPRLQPCEGCGTNHSGYDMGTFGVYGVEIRPVYHGVVSRIFNDECAGTTIWVWHSKYGVTSVYSHLQSVNVVEGQAVDMETTVLGGVGSTGRCSTGPHLHFGIMIDNTSIDPEAWLYSVQ